MKYTFLIFFIIFSITACNNIDKNQLNTRKIQLIDSLGEVTITLPADFDTFHSWRRADDYKCGDKMFYRFQSSKYSTKQESGFYSVPSDTFFALTVKHSYYFKECGELNFKDYNLNSAKKEIIRLQKNLNSQNPFDFFKDEKVNDVNYLFYATTDTIENGKVNKEFIALTYYIDIPLTFEFFTNIDSFQTDNFIEQCIGIMKTVKINKH